MLALKEPDLLVKGSWALDSPAWGVWAAENSDRARTLSDKKCSIFDGFNNAPVSRPLAHDRGEIAWSESKHPPSFSVPWSAQRASAGIATEELRFLSAGTSSIHGDQSPHASRSTHTHTGRGVSETLAVQKLRVLKNSARPFTMTGPHQTNLSVQPPFRTDTAAFFPSKE
jgi:hypothetical protein